MLGNSLVRAASKVGRVSWPTHQHGTAGAIPYNGARHKHVTEQHALSSTQVHQQATPRNTKEEMIQIKHFSSPAVFIGPFSALLF
jgi:hypothetical protein